MKNKLLFYLILTFLIGFSGFAQSGVNTKVPKATLDVVANTLEPNLASGLIAPRVTRDYLITNTNLYTLEQRGTIVYVYDVNDSKVDNTESSTVSINKDGYYYFDGNLWLLFVVPDEVVIPSEPWKIEAIGVEATESNQNIVHSGRVGIGFSEAINPSAELEIKSSSKGLLIPRMNTGERNAIANPANSLMIFNTDSSCFEFYKVNKWKSICGDLGTADILIQSCNSAKIVGEYKVDDLLTSSNYFQVTLNVVEPGNYSILVNDTLASFFFQKDGVFPNPGTYTIQIPAIGSPSIQGVKTFSLVINDEDMGCDINVNVLPASVSFDHLKFVSADVLKKGQSSAGKKMNITVDIINGGTFNFETNAVNGVSYSVSNVNLTPGNDIEVVLYANGNPPANAGTFNYSITGTGYSGGLVSGSVVVEESLAQISNINCQSAVVNGLLKLDTVLTSSNYIDIPVTTSSTGTYTINVSSTDNPGFSYIGSGNLTSIGTSLIRVYGSGTPTKAGSIPFVITINNATCNINLDVVLPPKNVLMLGTNSSYVRNALNNTTNFGPNGTSKIESINIIQSGSYTATQLENAIEKQNVQVILMGWGWNVPTNILDILSNFVKNKKGFVFWVESQNRGDNIKYFLDKTYGGNVTMTNNDYGIYTAKISSDVPATNPYINGVFGSAAGKYFRADDAASWVGAVPGTLPPSLNYLVHLPANGGAGINTNSERNTEIYGDGFFMYSDWGFINNTGNQYGSNNPIGFSTNQTSGNSSNGTTVSNVVVPAGQVANWIIFGNAMDYIFKYVQNNFDSNGSL